MRGFVLAVLAVSQRACATGGGAAVGAPAGVVPLLAVPGHDKSHVIVVLLVEQDAARRSSVMASAQPCANRSLINYECYGTIWQLMMII